MTAAALTCTITAVPAAADDTNPGNEQSAESTATQEEKFAAAAAAGVEITGRMLYGDNNAFLAALIQLLDDDSVIYDQAKVAANGTPADRAKFIKSGIKDAGSKHLQQIIQNKDESKARRAVKKAKKEAAQLLGISPDDPVINDGLSEFIQKLSEVAKERGYEQTASRASTLLNDKNANPLDLFKFIFSDIKELTRKDRELETQADAARKMVSQLQGKYSKAKAKAILVAVGRKATEAELEYSDKELVQLIAEQAKEEKVRNAAWQAVEKRSPEALTLFLLHGVYKANTAVRREKYNNELDNKRSVVKGILRDAKATPNEPSLVAAAEAALSEGTLEALNAFIDTGQHQARVQDHETPVEDDVVRIKGVASGLCIQPNGSGDDAKRDDAEIELGKCDEEKQLWTLKKWRDRWLLVNKFSGAFLEAGGAGEEGKALRQSPGTNSKPNSGGQIWEFHGAGKGFFQIYQNQIDKVATAQAGGTLVIQTADAGKPEQQWQFLKEPK